MTVDGSVAAFLDDLRAAIVAAWDDGRRPGSAVVHPAVYERIAGCRGFELRRGLPLVVMGMAIVPGDVPVHEPRVR